MKRFLDLLGSQNHPKAYPRLHPSMGELASCQILFQRKLKGVFTISNKITYFHYRHIFFFFFQTFSEDQIGGGFFFEKKKGFTILMNSFFPVMKTQENLYWSFWRDWRSGELPQWTQWQNQRKLGRCCVLQGGVLSLYALPNTWERVFSLPGSCYHCSRTLVVLEKPRLGNHWAL